MQSVTLLKNRKIPILEITIVMILSRIIPVQVALDFEIGHVNKPLINKEGLDSLQLPFMFKCLSMTELVILCFV